MSDVLHSKQWHLLLAAIKGLRNGVVYGVRIRAPHALVMTFLFAEGTLLEKLLTIGRLTRTHAQNLAAFVFAYKLLTGGAARVEGERAQWHSLAAAALVGYLVFGRYNGVNMQINLYLLSRIVVGLARLAVERGYLPQPATPVFPWFAAAVWGVVLWLFEYHKPVLQPSLQNSMTYLCHDSNFWTCFYDFFCVNRIE